MGESPDKQKAKGASLENAVRKSFPNLKQDQANELATLIDALLARMHVQANGIEAVYRSRARNTITVITQTKDIEIGLDPSFGHPRVQYRDLMRPAQTEEYFDKEPETTPDLIDDVRRLLQGDLSEED